MLADVEGTNHMRIWHGLPSTCIILLSLKAILLLHQCCSYVKVLHCRVEKQQPQPFIVNCHMHSEDLLSTRSPHIIWNQVRKRRFLPYDQGQSHVPLHADQGGVGRDVMLCYQAPDSLSTVVAEVMTDDADRVCPVDDGSNGRAFVDARVTGAR